MGPLVSLRNWLASFYQSALTTYAPGLAAGFSAWVAVRGGDGTQSDVATLFGNSNGATTGWRFTRLADVAESTPFGRSIPVAVQVFSTVVGSVSAIVYIPMSMWVGRTFLFGMTFSGNAGTLAFYANGVRLQAPVAFANALVPGASRLIYGISHAGANSRDELVSAAYSSFIGADAAARDLFHQDIFNQFKLEGGGLALKNSLDQAGIAAESIYDSYKIRGPFAFTPPTFVNTGTDLISGDLTFSGVAALQPRVDTIPNFTGAEFFSAPTIGGGPGLGADYGYFYSVTSTGTIAPEVAFPLFVNGAFTAGFTHVAGSTDIVIVTPGVYAVDYHAEVLEASQIALFLDAAVIPGTIKGSGAGTQQNTGSVIITTTLPNQILTLRNHTSAAAITPQVGPPAGGTAESTVSAVRIRRLA
jgi:hypothetical protein